MSRERLIFSVLDMEPLKIESVKQCLLSVAPRYEEEMNDEIKYMTEIVDNSMTTKKNEDVAKEILK